MEIWADDGNQSMCYDTDTAREAAQEYVDGGYWGEPESTIWVTVHTWREDPTCSTAWGGRFDEGKFKIPVHPKEPKCIDDHDHDWRSPHALVGGLRENPGVWGNSGGCRSREICVKCGWEAHTNTWAQDPEDGEQGLISVRYEENNALEEYLEGLRIKDLVTEQVDGCTLVWSPQTPHVGIVEHHAVAWYLNEGEAREEVSKVYG